MPDETSPPPTIPTDPSLEHAVYDRKGALYERLIQREDRAGRIPEVLVERCPWEGRDIVELGAGTGRLTKLLVQGARSLRAFDASPHMLAICREGLAEAVTGRVALGAAVHHALPVATASADLVVAGWALCYAIVDHPDDWHDSLRQTLDEVRRVLRPGGVLAVFETLGTGHETPHRPDRLLTHYLEELERRGFEHTWLRTDYRFASLAEAVELTEAFFGPELAARVEQEGWVDLPECTGLWWRRWP